MLLQKEILSTGTTQCLPFELCVANLVVGALWTLYGYLVDDVFMVVSACARARV
jgi:hypothetical protein